MVKKIETNFSVELVWTETEIIFGAFKISLRI